MDKIICRSCGDIFYNKKSLVFHILKLECFDENLNWRKTPEELEAILGAEE